MRRTARTLLPVGALVLLATVGATGCSMVEAAAHQRHTESFADLPALGDSEKVAPDWVPTDATAITLRTSTYETADDAVILLESGSPLASPECVAVERRSAPTWYLDGAPEVYELERVFACGDWSVAPTGDGRGWLGWTPNSPEERRDASSL